MLLGLDWERDVHRLLTPVNTLVILMHLINTVEHVEHFKVYLSGY